MDNCPFKDILDICVGSLSQNRDENVELRFQKSIEKINRTSKKRGIELLVEKGMIVHKNCRKRYINTDGDQNIVKKRKTEIGSIPSASLRSKASHGFKYSTYCILCETIAVDEDGQKFGDVYQIRSLDCQNKLIEACDDRLIFFENGDQWTENVRDRIFFANDLIAKDALYHNQCNVNFRNIKSMPKKCNPTADNISIVGRKKDEERSNAFKTVLSDFYENDETTTVKELVARMEKLVSNPYHERTMKRELGHIKGIVITKNIVSRKSTVVAVLNEFRSKKTSLMGDDEWKKHIIETAAELVKAEIDEKRPKRPIPRYI